MRQHDSADVRPDDAPSELARSLGVGNQKVTRAPPHGRNGKRGDERQTQPTAMGAREPIGRNRDADLRLEIVEQHRGGGERKESRKHHLTTKPAAIPNFDASICSIYCVMAATNTLINHRTMSFVA